MTAGMISVRRVCVFCGSRPGARPVYLEHAVALGRLLARKRIAVVYGGASVGLMGALADAALAEQGDVIGVIPQALVDREVAHHGLTALHVVRTMHERKAKMAELSDAFVVMPGGLGTLEELFEVASWGMLGLHRKPIVLLDSDGYWSALQAMLARAADEGFADPASVTLLASGATPEAVLERIVAAMPSVAPPLFDSSPV